MGKGSPRTLIISSPLRGIVVNLEDVEDPVFAEKMVGDGLAIKPQDRNVYSPAAGRITQLFPTHHALGITTDTGLEILLHLGLDTVKLKGEGFTAFVEEGQDVAAGDRLLAVDWDYVAGKADSPVSPVVITNMELVEKLEVIAEGEVNSGDDLFRVIIKEVKG
ncbi:MAG: PTS glucose transporter subunit IIA [Halanaerobium sp.]|nr:PTS glucose transporter subunit IIA [Halanaerobium sp.]